MLADGGEAEVDAALARQRGFDPDLWVIEVEDRAGRHLLDEDGLSDYRGPCAPLWALEAGATPKSDANPSAQADHERAQQF